ncbi:expansin-like B1 [Camellia sinensis]|uniref:expansin-like B1 n=1 Tax=Camellia sinensis TaxID=4442 RepID=UPI001035831E|nr:expansin-like B1 [Camellia sinensis]
MVKVHEHSRFPEYLASVMLYQAGQNDITTAEVWQADCQQWRGMRKAYSAVWDMANPPAGALNFRVQVSGSAGLKKVQLTSVIPSEWKAGAVYDTTIQLT